MWIVVTISSKFLALSYFFDMAPRLFQKVESLTFQKIYGGICHLKWYRWTNFMDLAHGLNGNIFRVTGPLCGEFTGTGEIPAQRPVTRSFDVFFGLRLNKRLSKQPWGRWFKTPSWSLWRYCNDHLYDPYSDLHTMQGWAESSAWHTSIVENTTIHSQ